MAWIVLIVSGVLEAVWATALGKIEGPQSVGAITAFVLGSAVSLGGLWWAMKDLPTAPAPGITLVAVPVRQDPRDVLCARDGLTFADLPAGARVGTGSARRAAQLLAARPDLSVEGLRGNIDTRLGKVRRPGGEGELDAVVLAAAGLCALTALFPTESRTE